jgi:peptidoglycan/xylan/chitin deacetylase (PgdA/CDA1 family)
MEHMSWRTSGRPSKNSSKRVRFGNRPATSKALEGEAQKGFEPMASGTDWLRELAKWLPEGAVRPFGRPVALFFHGVERRIDDPRVQLNQMGEDTFRTIARALKEHFNVLPLTELGDALKRPDRHERTVFLMSDDGYGNTLTVAADILEELKLPWTLFASTRYIGTNERNPMTLARLFFFFAPAGRYQIAHFADTIELSGDAQRWAMASKLLPVLKSFEAQHAEHAVAAMTDVFSREYLQALLERFGSEKFLTWEDLSSLAKRGVEIGAHANCHWPLHAAQQPEYLYEQVHKPREKIAAAIGSCRYFAYPFGNIGDISRAAWEAVRDAGYEAAFSTLSGSLDASVNRWLLPRYGLNSDDAHLGSLLPLLRAGNHRLTRWQKQLAA